MRPALLLLLYLIFLFHAAAQTAGTDNTVPIHRYIPAEKVIYYNLGETTIQLHLVQYGPARTYFLINVHDNEQTSVEAAKSLLQTRGGTLLRIQNNFQRLIRFRLQNAAYTFDPNSIFSRKGIEKSLNENGRLSEAAVNAVENFGKRVLQLLPDSIDCIIALHNNTENNYSVKSYLPGGDRSKDARGVTVAEDQDEDDMILTTDASLYAAMVSAGYNSILQDNKLAAKDGSLSVFCGEKGRRYINIETEHGKLALYREMLGKLLELLVTENKKSSSQHEEDSQ